MEPLPSVFETLKQNYRDFENIQFLNAAISHEDGEATIYSVDMQRAEHVKAHQFTSFSKDVILSQTTWTPNIADMIIEVPIKTTSFNTLMGMTGGREIDVLQIDAEGFDLQILKMIDFSKFKPKLLHYEHCNLNKADQAEAARMLAAQGYSLAMNALDVTAYLYNEVRFT